MLLCDNLRHDPRRQSFLQKVRASDEQLAAISFMLPPLVERRMEADQVSVLTTSSST